MSPQLLWTIAGLILTVLTLGGVTISSYQSMDSAKAKMTASEVGNIAIAGKLWLSNASADGTFTGIAADAITAYIPDLTVTGVAAASTFASKTSPGITYAIAAATPTSSEIITLATIPTTQTPLVKAALLGKACTVADGAPATTSLTYTCKG